MWRWCMSVCGHVLIAVAIAALASDSIVISYLGGSTRRGTIEDGRHFVEYKGHYTEVSESAWRFEHWLEWAQIWLVLIPVSVGMFLIWAEKPRDWQPPPVKSGEPPMREYLTGAGILMGFVAAGAWLGWLVSGTWAGAMRLAGGATWAVHLGGWLGVYVGGALALRLVLRAYAGNGVPKQALHLDAAPDRAGITPPQSS